MKRNIAIALLVVFALGISISYGVYRMNLGRRNIIAQLVAENSMINILVAGNNQYRDNTFRFYAIVSVNPENGKIGLTFIPPTYLTDLDDDGSGQRIEDVHLNDYDKLQKSLEKDLGLKIPFYAVFYAPDVVRIVDLIEGLTLFLFEDEKMLQGLGFGQNYVDGTKAVSYVNNVESGSIYYKYDRIMDIVYSLYKHREEYKQFLTLPFLTEAFSTIKSNMMPREMHSLGEYFFNDGGLYWIMLPGKLDETGSYVTDEIAAKVYAESYLKKLVIEEEGEKSAKVKILNATSVSGLARKFRYDLMKDGINVVEFGTYPGGNIEKTYIIDQKGDASLLEAVSHVVGTDNVFHVVDRTQLHDVLIILGNDLGASAQ